MWVFGYGSLVWRPDFPFKTRHPAFIYGWRRRFWQWSTDHRGIPSAPGRVATLVRGDTAERCWGTAYELRWQSVEEVVEHLDFRERGGYARHELDIHLTGRQAKTVRGLAYIATHENSSFAGPAPLQEIAGQITRARGPSGANTEYLRELADGLRAMGADDPHVFELEKAVADLAGSATRAEVELPLSLVPVAAADEPLMQALRRRAFRQGDAEKIAAGKATTPRDDPWSIPNLHWIAAGDVHVGALSMVALADRVLLHMVVVDPTYQGRGFAQRALELMTKEANARHVPVELCIRADNEPARRLCERAGFRTLSADAAQLWMCQP